MSNELDRTSVGILSDVTIYSKYAKHLPEEKRRETWEEIVYRNAKMHVDKYPHLEKEIWELYSTVLDKKVFPSMRSVQFAGPAIKSNEARIYNCSYIPMEEWEGFHELMFLLLGGTGVGYSVQTHHVKKLPPILGTNGKNKKYVVGDSIIGWADAVKVLVRSYFFNKPLPRFDFTDIRRKGSILKTAGGKAPGPQPLKDALHNIQKVFNGAIEERGLKCQLTTLEVHDICCYIADAVLAGGIRRAAMIALFSYGDIGMLECKFGKWYETNPQRARANNSVVLLRHKVRKKHFEYIWERVKASGSGEPGIYLSNNKDVGTNPCCEISLEPYSFCNLTTVPVGDVSSQEDLNNRIRVASAIGTIQASYTDFHYLRDIWKETTEKDSLIGVSMTGIGSGTVLKYNLKEAAEVAKTTNEEWAKKLKINKAARVTTIKPEGTSSCVAGTSSGIHAWYAPYYIRRLRCGKEEPIYNYLKRAIPKLVEDDFFKPETQAVISIPIKAPEGAIYRYESPMDLLRRVKRFHDEWVVEGHRKGDNHNNVSVTVSIKDNEWEEVGEWMWKNRNSYNGISVIPFDNGTYIQTPFEEITEEQYNELIQHARGIDLTKVKEDIDFTTLKESYACSAGNCDVTKIGA